MDVLSDVLAVMRTGRAASTRTEARGPWSLRFPSVAGAGFHVVLQGGCLLLPPGGGDPLRLGPGDTVFLRHGSAHTLCDSLDAPVTEFRPHRLDPNSPIGQIKIAGSGPKTVLLCGAYRLDVERLHPLLGDLPEVIHLPARLERHGDLRGAIDQLSRELDLPRPGSDSMVASLVDQLLVLVLRAWHDEQPSERTHSWSAALSDPVMAQVLRAIHDDPGRAWTVESLGEHVGLSRAVFARRFTTLVGQPPLAYLTSWRMTTAGRLLRETGMALATVAESAGYTSEFAFAKAFKRQYGLPPGRYRRLHRA